MKLYTIKNNAYGYENTLLIKNDHIVALSENGSNAVIELRRNNSHIIKFNKKSISTNNIEMFVNAIENNTDNFINVFAFVFDYKLLNSADFAKRHNVTISQFYNSFNDRIGDFITFFKSCSPETKQIIIYDHICFNHESKMAGVISLSTYVGNNRFCLARCKNCNAICSHCYASSLTKQRQGLKNKLIRIMAILTNVELTAADVPKIDASIYPYFRFESFGDINNVLQFKNFNLIAAVNPGVNFTLWTKNPGIIQAAINGGLQLADNLIIGLSSLYLNKPEIDKAQRYSFIRFLFTVYSPNYIEENNVIINCGAKHCVSCGICYKYLHNFKHGLQLINEKLK